MHPQHTQFNVNDHILKITTTKTYLIRKCRQATINIAEEHPSMIDRFIRARYQQHGFDFVY